MVFFREEARNKKNKRPRASISFWRRTVTPECKQAHVGMKQAKNNYVYSSLRSLASSQEIHGNRWALVAAELPGKTGQQCAQRWRHKVNPAIKKEKWTPEEDAEVGTRGYRMSHSARRPIVFPNVFTSSVHVGAEKLQNQHPHLFPLNDRQHRPQPQTN